MNYNNITYQSPEPNSFDISYVKYILHLASTLPADDQVAIDLGCGTGKFSTVLSDFFGTVYSIDREKATSSTMVCNFSYTPLPFADQTIDFIFCKSVIEHLYIPEITFMLGECRRVLKKTGTIVVITPDWLTSAWDFYDGYTHVTPFTERSLSTALRMSDFSPFYTSRIRLLPLCWKSSFFEFLSRLTQYFPIYRRIHPWVRWSKELQVISIAKP